MAELTFDDYKNRISIQEVLQDAGYHFYRRDGLRYPSYVRLDDEGRRIRGDKYIVCANGMACFQPPQQRRYNVISFIAEHPELFPEGRVGKDPYAVVNEVCHRLLNMPMEDRQQRIVEPLKDTRPFNLGDYKMEKWEADKWESQTKFFPFFKHRGITRQTQRAFANSFLLTTYGTHQNLSFPMVIPGKDDKGIVGFEERGRVRADGTSYKGMARGSNASEGLWLGSPNGTKLQDAKRVFLFESAYDAMAFYQLLMGSNNLTYKEKNELKSGVYASTGGNPSARQLEGLMRTAKEAIFHLGFDMDDAGKTFAEQFKALGRREQIAENRVIREECSPGYKDFNEELLGTIKKKQSQDDAPDDKDENVELADEEKKEQVGYDMDADGNLELGESDETKHYKMRR